MKKKKFHELLQSIDQAWAIHGGKRKPGRVYRFDPTEIRKIRILLKLSQPQFASMLCVSIGTLRNWEQGRTYPGGAAVALLRVAKAKPEVLLETLHVT